MLAGRYNVCYDLCLFLVFLLVLDKFECQIVGILDLPVRVELT